jgi:hypothetical protein
MRSVENVARTREKRNAYSVAAGKPKGKQQFENLGVDEMITLKCTLQK